MNFTEIPPIPAENTARCPQLLHCPERQLHRLIKGSDQIPQGTVAFGFNVQWVLWLIVLGIACTATTVHVHKNTQTPPYKGTTQAKTNKTPSTCIPSS